MKQQRRDDVAGSPQPRDAELGRKPAAPEPLDNPVFSALSTEHAAIAQRQGRALRYPAEVSPFMALPSRPHGDDWPNLALLARGDDVVFFAPPEHIPHHWEKVYELKGLQMVDAGVGPADDQGIVTLGPDDVPEMLDLATRTKPGPFLPGTAMLGTYLGIREGGELVAMAGERFRFPGGTEISAVCTSEDWRGRGLAARLIRILSARIRERGDLPFLHVVTANRGAVRLYETLGFATRTDTTVVGLRYGGNTPPSLH
ncbi:ribosomal protein S18 acetylase RimI-like enzyme [Streptomyces aurantiacus]|uniref:GNAT family N-acetyltransferase n=1 Tax=Streptomyces aurantiacus TaxID=47760 RepID=UPI00278E917B|nr:GNAT family N-acetyltransferase [Streptomyces aurantiacus]MDQ0779034.1 ribosomal protein S18 acetylase RimI-like enzyme [Streptomyces aurantiacus]